MVTGRLLISKNVDFKFIQINIFADFNESWQHAQRTLSSIGQTPRTTSTQPQVIPRLKPNKILLAKLFQTLLRDLIILTYTIHLR